MPAYSPTGVRVRLGAASLADTVTRGIVARKGEVAAKQSEAAEKKLKESKFLREESIQFPGDTQDFPLHFLKNVPFKQVQVQAGADLFQVDSLDASHGTEMMPKALILHVILSEDTFLLSFDDDKPQNLMIDVFFNGILTSSVLIHLRDISSGVKSFHQVFAGTRVDHMAERPWVILPPGQNADGSRRGLKSAMSVKERWEQVCSALLDEANERGVNDYGDRSPSGDYLHSLATMEMSEAVEQLQTPGGRRFGVIDVVITAGHGKKVTSGTKYLKKPSRLVDNRYSRMVGSKQQELAEATAETQTKPSSEQDAEGEADSDFGLKDTLEDLQLPPVPVSVPGAQPPSLLLPAFQSPVGGAQRPSMPSPEFSSLLQPFQITIPGPSSAHSPPEFNSFSSPNFQHSQSHQASMGQLNVSPYNPAFSDPMQALSSTNPSLDFDSLPLLRPSQGREVSFGHANVTSFNPGAPPNETPQTLGISGRGMFVLSGSPANISTLAHMMPGAQGRARYQGNSFGHGLNYPPPGPPPPVGYFSSALPTLPQPDQGLLDSNQPRSHFLLSRLIITGKDGKVIVDRHWQVAQRIAVKPRNPAQSRSPTRHRQESPGSTEYSKPSAGAPRQSRNSNRLTTPPPTSPGLVDPDMTLSIDKKKGDTVHDGYLNRNPVNPPSIGPAFAHIAETQTASHTGMNYDMEPFIDDSVSTVPATPAVPYRRSNHSNLALHVQGRKAVPFILEDPEVLLRRSRSPTKQSAVPFGSRSNRNADENVSVGRKEVVNLLESGSSSLSSAPSSPEPVSSSQQAKSAPLVPLSQESLPIQPKFLSQATVSVPVPSSSEPPTKRQRTTLPRSILIENDNPSLNQDCVIAYAEGSMQNETGKVEMLLRQVKSERQGVFKESEIVVGMRFFVMG